MAEEIKQDQPLNIVEEARQERVKIEQLMEETKKLLNQNQEIQAKILLSGRAHAGETIEKKEETPKEYADRVMRNTLK